MATIQLVLWLVTTIDDQFRRFFPGAVPMLDKRGMGVLVAVTLILVAGFLTHNFIGRWILNFIDHAIRRVALVGGLYASIKKFFQTIFHPDTDQFHGTVLVQFPRQGVYSIGFRTGKPDGKLQRKLKMPVTNIFVPCTPNPTSGFYLLVPEEELIPLDMSVQEAFKIIISMGIVTSDESKAP
jgi:uncharacterized membrane protein